MNPPGSLVTPRLVLEPASTEHHPGLWKAVLESLPELRRWMRWAQEPDPSETLAFLEQSQREATAEGAAVFVVNHGGEHVGVVSLIRGNPAERFREVGYWVRSDLAGKGLVTEATAHLIRHAFGTLGLHRLELHCALENLGSIKVAEKLGFDRRGILRETGFVGEWLDMYVYDLLETDPPIWERFL